MYKMIWTATQRRNRNFFYFYVASPSKSFYMNFRSQHNAAQILASYYKPTVTLVQDKVTPVYIAAQYGHVEALSILISTGADFNNNNSNSLPEL